jgi:CDGSH-type Zn-finger protein
VDSVFILLIVLCIEIKMPKIIVKGVENGPNLVLVDGKTLTALCRCGGSANKPYCDGTHKKNNFRASPSEVVVFE